MIETAALPEPLPLRVLVADDSPVQRMFAEHALRSLGHQTITASDGQEAVEAVLAHHPDVVLLDLEMPVLDGRGACLAIRQLALARQPAILFVTASHDEEELAACLEVGGDMFLNKPISIGILGAQLASVARNRLLAQLATTQADELMQHQQRIIDEHRVAREVFDRVLSNATVSLPNVRTLQADASSFAGDFVLTAESPSGVQYMMLGDCTGHGLPAALTAMPAATAFRSLVKRSADAAAILSGINDRLVQALPEGYFVAAALIGWDPLHRMLTVWNGGLPDVHIWRAHTGIVQSISSMHPPLGILPSAATDFLPAWVEVRAGDRVIVHSDGVSEARSANDSMFGDARVRRALGGESTTSPLEALHQALGAFSNAPQADDIAIAELVCVPSATSVAAHRGDAQGVTTTFETGGDEPSSRVVLEIEAGALRVVDPLPIASQLALALPVIAERGADVQVVLTELVANAVQHGVLGLASSSKATPEGFADFYREVRQRTAAVRHGWVRVELAHTVRADRHYLAIKVSDSGEGFDPDTIRAVDANPFSGRGLQLVREMSDEVRVLDAGRTVEATLSWQRLVS